MDSVKVSVSDISLEGRRLGGTEVDQESLRGRLLRAIRENPGRSVGTLLGLLTGVCLIWLGLWKTLVLSPLDRYWYSIGKWTDEEG